jgi:Bacteriophage Sf6, terminase small subunit-like
MQLTGPPQRRRPSLGYSEQTATTICERLMDGESLRAICADPAMPAKATVCRWLARNAEFRSQYAFARQLQVEHFADEMLEILDDCSDLRHVRRRIGALKLAVARLSPKKYGKR